MLASAEHSRLPGCGTETVLACGPPVDVRGWGTRGLCYLWRSGFHMKIDGLLQCSSLVRFKAVSALFKLKNWECS